jgi:hypothetical protein
MYFEVTMARYVRGYCIELHFEDGASGIADLAGYLEAGTVLEQLKDEALFKSFQVEYGTLVWKNGELDIAPETLYTQATGRSTEFARPSGIAS